MSKSSTNDYSKQLLAKLSAFVKWLHTSKTLYILPIPILAWALYLNFHSEVSIFPLQQNFKLTTNVDTIEGGNSSIQNLNLSDSTLSFQYVRRKGYAFPYVGIIIEFDDSTLNTPFNLNGYDDLNFTLSITGSKNQVLTLYLSCFEEGITQWSKPGTWRRYDRELTASSQMSTYKLPFTSFKTPGWWWDSFTDVNNRDYAERDFSHAMNLVIENGQFEAEDQNVSVVIQSITASKNLKSFNLKVLFITLFYYLFYWYSLVFGLPKGEKTVIISYKELDVSSYADEDTAKINHYVADNYSNQELTVKQASQELGISQSKIQVILKTHFKMTFRQYLNTIKIHEAKRLLLDTDRQVTDIAYRVGYKNVTHFNRIFKDLEAMSPNQYRKSNKDK